MKILVIAEHNHAKLDDATLSTVGAAQILGGPVTILVGGTNCYAAGQDASSINGISSVIVCDDPVLEHFTAEPFAELVVALADSYTHILAPASTFGKNILPRIAGVLGVAQISDVIRVESEDTFVRPVYAGNALATIKSHDPVKLLTVRTTSFPKATKGNTLAPVHSHNQSFVQASLTRFINMEENHSERPELTNARIVVSGGRGLQGHENFQLVEKLADTLGAAVGASRAAVDAGYVPNDCQVGQTGKIVAPELYIAVGISGAIQHLAGMKDSKVIVAINKDEEAPIFQVADYGLVGDLFQILPELTNAIQSLKKTG